MALGETELSSSRYRFLVVRRFPPADLPADLKYGVQDHQTTNRPPLALSALLEGPARMPASWPARQPSRSVYSHRRNAYQPANNFPINDFFSCIGMYSRKKKNWMCRIYTYTCYDILFLHDSRETQETAVSLLHQKRLGSGSEPTKEKIKLLK